MREIKFRAMQKPSGMVLDMGYKPIMLFGTGIIKDPVNTWLVSSDPTQAIAFGEKKDIIETETLGQFTGLRDKNNKEIYEGDIIEYQDVKEFGEERMVEIKRHTVKDLLAYINAMNWIPYSGEVIGNIHENPELLKANQ